MTYSFFCSFSFFFWSYSKGWDFNLYKLIKLIRYLISLNIISISNFITKTSLYRADFIIEWANLTDMNKWVVTKFMHINKVIHKGVILWTLKGVEKFLKNKNKEQTRKLRSLSSRPIKKLARCVPHDMKKIMSRSGGGLNLKIK